MKKFTSIILAVSFLAFGFSTQAFADGKALYTSKLCGTCHGPDGKKPIMPTYPKIAGQNAAYSLQQIKDIRDGKRKNGMAAAMKALVASLSDADAKTIADWLATVK